MRIRTVLVMAVLALTAGCGGAESDTSVASAEDGPVKRVASWGEEGGFVPPTVNVLRPPKVVVYGDGLVVVDASRQLKLSDAEVGETVEALGKSLNGQPPTAEPRPGAPTVTDVPTTVFGVRGQDAKVMEVRVPALEQVADFYPKQLSDAKDLMNGLATRAAKEGTDYVATRVRLVAEGAASAEGKPESWPAGVPEPSGQVDPVWRQDLEGAAATALAKAVPAGQEYGRALFKTSSGGLFVLSWRYLLPDE